MRAEQDNFDGAQVGKHQSKSAKAEQIKKMQKLKEISERMSKLFEEAKAGSLGQTAPPFSLGGFLTFAPPIVMGDEYIMSRKAHGSSATPVQDNLRWGCDRQLADQICNFNRHGAENAGYFVSTSFLHDAAGKPQMTFHDSNTGKTLFVAPCGRSMGDFLIESKSHGWPSFRDAEVDWSYVRVLPNGEVVSLHGTHLGHNLPDHHGNRYCINLVSVAGQPLDE